MELIGSNLVLVLVFADSTSRTYTLNGMEQEAVPDVKDKILALNENMPENFKRTFVSNNGAQCATIANAKIVSIEEEVIYRAS